MNKKIVELSEVKRKKKEYDDIVKNIAKYIEEDEDIQELLKSLSVTKFTVFKKKDKDNEISFYVSITSEMFSKDKDIFIQYIQGMPKNYIITAVKYTLFHIDAMMKDRLNYGKPIKGHVLNKLSNYIYDEVQELEDEDSLVVLFRLGVIDMDMLGGVWYPDLIADVKLAVMMKILIFKDSLDYKELQILKEMIIEISNMMKDNNIE